MLGVPCWVDWGPPIYGNHHFMRLLQAKLINHAATMPLVHATPQAKAL